MQPKEDGQRFRARIVCKIIEMEENKEKIKFLVKLPDEEQDEIMAYSDIIEIIADQYDDELNNLERKWLFTCITAHEGPLSTKHPNQNGSKYNLLVQWEDGFSVKMTRYPARSMRRITICWKYPVGNDSVAWLSL